MTYYTHHGISEDHIKSVNVCDSSCCSYMEEHGFENTHHCQEDCSAADPTTTAATTTTTATTTDQTGPDADVPTCDNYSRYWHPEKGMTSMTW